MGDDLTAMGGAILEKVDALVKEVKALDEAYLKRRESATRLERRDMPAYLPGLNDFVVCIEGCRHPIQKILSTRNEVISESEKGPQPAAADSDDDVQAREEQEKKDKAKIANSGQHPHADQWAAIKRCHGLLVLRRRFTFKNGVFGPTVDAVVENGIEWLKVSTIRERKLVYQMAQEGWHPDDSDDESDFEDNDDSGIDIVRTTDQLVRAARANRCNNRIPRVHFFLPNIIEGNVDAIDKLINKVRRMGVSKRDEGDVEVVVNCANSTFGQADIPPLETAFANLFRNTQSDRLTNTLNLELTLLISLVSDITHSKPEVEPWYSQQTVSHIKDEEHSPGLRLRDLYTALRNRHLVSTEEVVQEFSKIVEDLGTATTKSRAAILLGRTPKKQDLAARQDLVSKLRELSIHQVPEDLQLPIKVVSKDEFSGSHSDIKSAIEAGTLPPVASHVFDKLDRQYHRTCYLYGWANKMTTVSANSLTVRQIEAVVDKYRTNAKDTGPDMFLTSLAISLNTAHPCPEDRWDEIKNAKHERRGAREKEAKQMKKAGVWGPSLGLRCK